MKFLSDYKLSAADKKLFFYFYVVAEAQGRLGMLKFC